MGMVTRASPLGYSSKRSPLQTIIIGMITRALPLLLYSSKRNPLQASTHGIGTGNKSITTGRLKGTVSRDSE
jgi:hypothetical protein